jgi:hypothetical protein
MKGNRMKSNILNSMLKKGLVFTACITLACASAFAQGTVETDDSKEVLSELEQHMQKPITVDFRNTLIDDVLRIMAEQADVDIIKSPQVIRTWLWLCLK